MATSPQVGFSCSPANACVFILYQQTGVRVFNRKKRKKKKTNKQVSFNGTLHEGFGRRQPTFWEDYDRYRSKEKARGNQIRINNVRVQPDKSTQKLDATEWKCRVGVFLQLLCKRTADSQQIFPRSKATRDGYEDDEDTFCRKQGGRSNA